MQFIFCCICCLGLSEQGGKEADNLRQKIAVTLLLKIRKPQKQFIVSSILQKKMTYRSLGQFFSFFVRSLEELMRHQYIICIQNFPTFKNPTAKRKLERLQFSTSSSFVKI